MLPNIMILQKSLEIARVFSVVVVLRYQKLQSLEITAKMSKGSKGPNQMESSFQIPINTPMLLQGGRKHRMRPPSLEASAEESGGHVEGNL